MDNNIKIIDLLRGTIDPKQQKEAETQLDEIHKIIGFFPQVLKVAMSPQLDNPVRQAAAIYLKNAVIHDWEEKKPVAGQPYEFSIHEQDKSIIRNAIVEATVVAPENIRSHMGTCVNYIVKYDFPGKWPTVIDQISLHLQADRSHWPGALVVMYQLVKIYEYKNGAERGPLDQAMKILLPQIYQICAELMPEDSDQALLVQKQIFKILYAYIQYHMSQSIFTRNVFLQWMGLVQSAIEKPIPPRVDQLDNDDKVDSPAWKVKKWALHIVARVFDRYGSPGSAAKEFKSFADWYIKMFSEGMITSLLKILEQHANNIYVSPRVLQQTLNYITTSINNAYSWKLVKRHIDLIIQNIVFPLLCYSEEDKELWETDPQEYIRMKFDVFEDYVSPVTAAQNLLHTVCKKRKDMLAKTLQFVVGVLGNQSTDARHKDGALHMVGSVADVLLKKDLYKAQLEPMLVTYVFPAFESPFGFLRARACWVLNYFADVKFQNEENVIRALLLVQKCILQENDLPVKVEAAQCYQALINAQERAEKAAEAHVAQVTIQIANLIRETENEDLTNVMQKLICNYTEQLVPIALQMTEHLAKTFELLVADNNEDSVEDKSLTAMSLLNTIDTILTMMEDKKEIMIHAEPIVVQIVVKVLQEDIIDLYEEVFNLVCTITTSQISADSWKIFELIYQVFNRDGLDYFTEMMPSLHNYVTVDPPAFLSNRNHILALYDMCKKVLNTPDAGEDAEAHAAKLLEVMIVQFRGQIDDCIHPFVELVLARLTREIKTDELRTMCLLVVVAALWYNPEILFHTLQKLQPPGSTQPLFDHFMKQFMEDTHCFQGLHDRKVAVLGLVTLMTLPVNQRPAILNELTPQIMPSALLLFEGLKVAYQAKAASENESTDDETEETTEDDDPSSDPEDLEDDQDHIPATMDDGEDEEEYSDEDEDDDEYEQTVLESYLTPLDDDDTLVDEYILFKQTMERLQMEERGWFENLLSPLTGDQQKTLNEVYTLANQRKAAAESKAIEKHGGYKFQNQDVPNAFNFGGKPNFG